MLDKENLIKWLEEDIKIYEKDIENPITDDKWKDIYLAYIWQCEHILKLIRQGKFDTQGN